ncbi:MAG: MBL fold metallo-hydrolase [Planctomycetes bacterium]|nr:MBL fold metallo-hydrolase [Planctomycetota bacterium]
MQTAQPAIVTVLSVPFEENSYIAYFQGRKDCLVIDPGLEPEKISAAIDELGLSLAAILCTHGHADHIAGNAALKERWPEAPIIIGEGDAIKLTDPVQNLSAGFGGAVVSPPADQTVNEGDVIEFAGFRLEVLDTPGHSTGHVVFVLSEQTPVQVFGGDVLFAGSIGRTDFPDCSFAVLKQSIHEKLFPLADEAVVWPGHGPTTTIGDEKRTNPFVGLNSRFEG